MCTELGHKQKLRSSKFLKLLNFLLPPIHSYFSKLCWSQRQGPEKLFWKTFELHKEDYMEGMAFGQRTPDMQKWIRWRHSSIRAFRQKQQLVQK